MAFTDRLANRGSISTGFTIENSIYLDGNVPVGENSKSIKER